MRIRRLLIAGIALAFGLVLMRLVMLEVHVSEGRRLDEFQLNAERISRDAAGLAVLSQDVVLHNSAGSVHRWHAVHANLIGTLPAMSGFAADMENDVEDLSAVARRLPALFDAIEVALTEPDRAAAQPRLELLAGHLASETRRVSDGAFDLVEHMGDLRRARDLADRRVTWATMAGFALLVLGIAVVVARRVLRPMAGLQAAAQAVRGGALDARSGYRANDEFGNLSRGFDDMTQALHLRTAGLAAALRENEALLSTIRLHAIFSVADRAGKIIEANDNFCAITGYSREELIGQNHHIVNSGAQDHAFWVDMWRTISSGKPWRGEICNRAKDSSLYWVDSIIAPFIGADGRIEKYISIRTDITGSKLAAALLQAAHDRFEIAADSANIGVWEYDIAAGTLVWDDRMYRLYGCERSAALEPYGLWANSLHPADRQRTEAALRDAMLGSRDYDPEFRIIWTSGEVRHLKGSARVIRDAAGAALRMTGVNIDITERKRAELELMSTTSLLRTVLDSASEVAIIATDPGLGITVFNTGAELLLGYAAAEMVGRATPMLIHDRAEVQARGVELSAQLGRTVEGAAVFTESSTLREPREWTYVRKDGGRVTVSLVLTAMQGDDGRVFGYLGIAHDVTRQKAYEESLRKAMYAARKASLAKSEFLANMSHEIRTPMNAVIGLSYLLEQTGLDAQQKGYLGKISLASKSLMALINDILDLSKVEAGELTLEQATFKLDHLLKNLADVMGVHADAKGIALTIDAPPDLPLVKGDARRLNQILTNLLANAIKFTARGGVKLVVRQLCAVADGVRLRFAVQDSGIGIKPEEQAKLFEPFTQADVSTTRRFGGTGLGLSIVKRLTTAMGGSVGLVSTPNVGSEFWVELEFGRAAPAAFAQHPEVPPGQRALPGARVLVVDDSDINLEVARRILELEGAQVTLACNGEEAYAKLQATPQAFDLVLMDVQMPLLDGYEAARRIRDELQLTALPILALTAGAMTSERQRAAEAGMNGLIAKPFDPRELALGVRRYVQRDLDAPAAEVTIAVDTAMPGASPWPVIEGIDAADVSTRFGGDVALFRSILGSVLDEFTDVTLHATEPDEAVLALQAGRMHKLLGAAGSLGMRAVSSLAGEAETACRAGDATRAAECAQRIAIHLQALRADAVSFLSVVAPEPEAETPPGDDDADQHLLVEISRLLRERSLAALDLVSAASAPLRRLLGNQSYDEVRDRIDKLQFEDAVRMLAGVARPCAESMR